MEYLSLDDERVVATAIIVAEWDGPDAEELSDALVDSVDEAEEWVSPGGLLTSESEPGGVRIEGGVVDRVSIDSSVINVTADIDDVEAAYDQLAEWFSQTDIEVPERAAFRPQAVRLAPRSDDWVIETDPTRMDADEPVFLGDEERVEYQAAGGQASIEFAYWTEMGDQLVFSGTPLAALRDRTEELLEENRLVLVEEGEAERVEQGDERRISEL